MVCTFVRTIAVCKTEDQALKVKSLFDPILMLEDFTHQPADIKCFQEIGSDDWKVVLDMYVIDENQAIQYIDKFVQEFEFKKDKSKFVSVRIIKNDNCTHDEENPQPDIIEEVFNWVG